MTEKSKKAFQSEKWQKVREIVMHEAIKEYITTSYADAEEQCEITVHNVKYKVQKRDNKTTFYDENGNTLFDVDNEMLAAEYEKLSENQIDPETPIGKTIESIEKQAFDYAMQSEDKEEDNNVAKCVTGNSESGICGAAAYCDKGVKCCSECQEPCNSRCGWLDDQEKRIEKISEDETKGVNCDKKEAVDSSGIDKSDEEKGKTEKLAPVYSGVDGAIAKLQTELKNAKEKEFAGPVIEYLIGRCKESESLAADICQGHKTWEKCYKYIYEEARKKLNSRSGPVRSDVVFEWAEDYFHLDDKALEEKKAKEEAERKKKVTEKKKQDAEKRGKTTSESTKSKKVEEKKPSASKQQKKNELDGQIDFLSMLGM